MVTGAGSVGPGWGNGKATAVLLARQGAKVFAIDVNEWGLRDIRAERVREVEKLPIIQQIATADVWDEYAPAVMDYRDRLRCAACEVE